MPDDGAFRPNNPSVYNVYVESSGATKLHPVTGTTGLRTEFRNLRGQAAKNIACAEYKSVLERTFIPEGRRIFSGQGLAVWTLQQDNDPAHSRAGDVLNAHRNDMRGSVVNLLSSWPGNSPDLSPIENVWAYVDAQENEQGCRTFQEYKAAVDFHFQSIPRDKCIHLFDSVPRRLQHCVELGGATTKY